MTQPRLHPEAEVEYVEALLYLEAQREGYGERFEAEVDATLDRIRAFPLSGALVEGYRETSKRGHFRCGASDTR